MKCVNGEIEVIAHCIAYLLLIVSVFETKKIDSILFHLC